MLLSGSIIPLHLKKNYNAISKGFNRILYSLNLVIILIKQGTFIHMSTFCSVIFIEQEKQIIRQAYNLK